MSGRLISLVSLLALVLWLLLAGTAHSFTSDPPLEANSATVNQVFVTSFTEGTTTRRCVSCDG